MAILVHQQHLKKIFKKFNNFVYLSKSKKTTVLNNIKLLTEFECPYIQNHE